MTVLVVKLTGAPSLGQCQWALLSPEGRVLDEGERLEGPTTMRHRRLVLIIPNERVTYARVDIPDPKLRRNQSALAYAVEDQVIEDIESFHVLVLHPGEAGKGAQLGLIKRAWLVEAIAQLAKLGLQPDQAIPEGLLATLPDAVWRVDLRHDGGLIRRGRFDSIPLDSSGDPVASIPQVLVAAIDFARKSGGIPKVIELECDPGQTIDTHHWETSLGGVKVVRLPSSDWRRLPAADAPDFLQGEFRLRRKVSFDWVDSLRSYAFASLLLSAGLLALYGVYAGKLLAEKAILSFQIQRSVAALFPNQASNGDPVRTLRNALHQLRHRNGLQDSNDLVPLLSRVIEKTPQLRGSLTGLNYEHGQMELLAIFATAESFAETAERLRSSGFSVAVLDIQSAGTGQQVRMRINLENVEN